MKSAKEIVSSIGSAIIAVYFLFGAGVASTAESPAIRAAIEGRGADYRRQHPGVPLWPSTCDCISVAFGFKDSAGYRPVRFRFADAVDYYGQSSDSMAKDRSSALVSKGPWKESAEQEMP